MQAFWRTEPLTEKESQLFTALLSAHYKSCFRDNASTHVLINTTHASGDLTKAIAAAILSTGDKHAPIVQTVQLLELDDPLIGVLFLLDTKQKVPGWGGTYQKNAPDPYWQQVDQLLLENWSQLHGRLTKITDCLKSRGKVIFPNPSAYTACVALALKLPAKIAPYFFIIGRLPAWAAIAGEILCETDHLIPNNSSA